jgi:undecaprenyl pyrophosphate phosphatase UppP
MVSLIFAFIVGILSIKVLLKVAEVINFGVFVIALGLLLILSSVVIMIV